ncbi:MAG TPA: hypothetical protein VGB83_11020 [Actinomycetota bacterium]
MAKRTDPRIVAGALLALGLAGGVLVYRAGATIAERDRAAVLEWQREAGAILREPIGAFFDDDRDVDAVLFADAAGALRALAPPDVMRPTAEAFEHWLSAAARDGDEDATAAYTTAYDALVTVRCRARLPTCDDPPSLFVRPIEIG